MIDGLKTVFIDTGADRDTLSKGMPGHAGLVQVQRTVQGKHGSYTRKQWVRASEVKDSDKVTHVPDRPMSDDEGKRRNAIEKQNQTARTYSQKYQSGTVISFKAKNKDGSSRTVTGVVQSVSFTNEKSKIKGIKETTAVNLKVTVGKGDATHMVTLNAMKPNSSIHRVSKTEAEQHLGRKIFQPEFFVKNANNATTFTEQQVREYYNTQMSDNQITYDDFVKSQFFYSDGYSVTDKAYKDKNGNYISSRQSLHNSIIQELSDSCDTAPVGSAPVCYLFGGGSASGKSSVVDPIMNAVTAETGVRVGRIDSDEIKKSLPEYVPMQNQDSNTAAMRVHDESSDVANQAIDELIKQGKCFAFDGTMKNPAKYSGIIDKLKTNGYNVIIIGVDIPTDEAIRRSEARAKATNRVVPEGIIRGSHGGFAATFPQLAEKVDEYYLYDNTQPEGQPPTLICSQDGISNEQMWQRFQKKGEDHIKSKAKKNHRK